MRFFDIIFSCLAFVFLLPIILLVSLLIVISSNGGVLYRQERIGRFGIPFTLYKFRTMYRGSDSRGLITIGQRDPRITKIGYHLRKYKIDEIPQLFNVIKGDMSIVGPRPEVEKYVNLYTDRQRLILKIRPGLSDFATIKYHDESRVIDESSDPESFYVNKVMPDKLILNLLFYENYNLKNYFRVILKTIKVIFW